MIFTPLTIGNNNYWHVHHLKLLIVITTAFFGHQFQIEIQRLNHWQLSVTTGTSLLPFKALSNHRHLIGTIGHKFQLQCYLHHQPWATIK